MVKKNQKSTSRNKILKVNRAKLILVVEVIILCLIVLASVLFVTIQKANNASMTTVPSASSRVNMLLASNDVSSGRVVKRTDPLTQSLRTFLEADVDSSGCPASQPDYDAVVAVTTNREQVFINYGCGSANSPAYVVYINNKWEFLSPTNQFSQLGFPACDYLKKNSISAQIAPVCVNDINLPIPQYTIRS